MRKIIIFLIISLSSRLLLAQDSLSNEGYYQSIKEYKNNSPRPAGQLLTSSSTDLVFSFSYGKLYFNSRLIWGYRDKEGNDYKSIDGKFYKIISASRIFVFELKENNTVLNKMSDGPGGYPMDITTDNILLMLSDDESLANEFKSLSAKEKKLQAMTFIQRYNNRLETNLVNNSIK